VTHPPNCANPTGSIEVLASGSGSLEYSVDNGVSWQASNLFGSLNAGIYQVSVRLASDPSCVASYTGNPVVINNPPGCCSPPVVNTPTVTQPTCSVSTGTIQVLASGLGAMEFSVDNGASWQSDSSFPNLPPGSYDIWVRYASETSCSTAYASNPVVLTAATGCCPVPTYLNTCSTGDFINGFTFGAFQNLNTGCANPSSTNLSNYQPLGPTAVPGMSAQVTVSVGAFDQAVGLYIDLNGDGDYLDSQEFFNLGTVNANGSSTTTIVIPAGTPPGSSTLRLRCRWSGNGLLTAADGCGTQLQYGETEDYNILFNDCVSPSVSAPTLVQPSCATPTGTITVQASGSGTLEYSVNGGTSFQAGSSFAGLSPGNYNVVVRLVSDPTCSAAYAGNPVTIDPVPSPPSVSAPTLVQPSCATPTGSITIQASGGGTLEYSVNGGASFQASPAFSNLAPGDYQLVVVAADDPTCSTSYEGNPITLSEPVNCCPSLLAVDDVPIPAGIYESGVDLTSVGSVAVGTFVTFRANASVTLLPGFEVEAGGLFEIQLEGCQPE
jgi:hypothetical protein